MSTENETPAAQTIVVKAPAPIRPYVAHLKLDLRLDVEARNQRQVRAFVAQHIRSMIEVRHANYADGYAAAALGLTIYQAAEEGPHQVTLDEAIATAPVGYAAHLIDVPPAEPEKFGTEFVASTEPGDGDGPA